MADENVVFHSNVAEINKNEWNDKVEHADRGSVFHRYEWLQAVEEAIGFEPAHITVRQDGHLKALLPNFVMELELPFDSPHSILERNLKEIRSVDPGYGGPLIMTDEERMTSLLFEALAELERSDIVRHQLRFYDTDYMRYSSYLQQNGYRPFLSTCHFEVDLDRSMDEIRAAMHKNKRYNLRKAKENDFEIIEEDLTSDTLRAFYDEYETVMDRVDGTAYPFAFFQAICEELSERIKLMAVVVNGDVVGRQFYILDDEQNAIHAFFSAVKEENFEYYPGELLDEYMMRWGREKYSTFDFGDTTASFDDGLYRYKNEFGARPLPIIIWERGVSPLLWNLFKLGRYTYRKQKGRRESISDR